LRWKTGKNVLSHLKERGLTSHFVLGVGGGRLPCNLPKILTVEALPLPPHNFMEFETKRIDI
jgi:hypothetical protein